MTTFCRQYFKNILKNIDSIEKSYFSKNKRLLVKQPNIANIMPIPQNDYCNKALMTR